ncbi:RecQ family ATP-dependent DNA helicase [Desulfofustis limnaeus]|nr:RecQ family ATP-dependent DNA helicase [Desulfofustis limnaeus]
MSTLALRILTILEGGQSLKARAIAAKVGAEQTEVNRELYGSLRGRVQKDSEFRWSLAKQTETLPTQNHLENTTSVDPPASEEVPKCQKCGRPMKLRTAKRGSNRGNQFCECSGFPDCQEIQPYEKDQCASDETEASPAAAVLSKFVEWRESKARANWSAEYVSVGAGSSLFAATVESSPGAARLLSQTLILLTKNRPPEPVDEYTAGLLAVAEKLLLRGRMPLPSLSVEEESLRIHGLENLVEDVSFNGRENGWEWRKAPPRWSDEALCTRRNFYSCEELTIPEVTGSSFLDSEWEERFIEIVATTDESLTHWLSPQVPIANLVGTTEGAALDDRRVDFLFSHPRLSKALVIEIDGEDHVPAVDQQRDRLLQNAGLEVYRIPNREIAVGLGPMLDKLLARIRTTIQQEPNRQSEAFRAGQFSLECAWGAKLQLAVLRAMQKGWLQAAADGWHIRIDSQLGSSVEAVEDLVRLLEAIEQIYEGYLLPGQVVVQIGTRAPIVFSRTEKGWARELGEPYLFPNLAAVAISLEHDNGPWTAYPETETDLVVRPAFAPHEFAPLHVSGSQTRLITSIGFDTVRPHLRYILQQIFRKQDFLEGQAEAIYNALCGEDCIVLLPTGGGKSIIYQLSGLLSPGITLVIDPLVSLIEDQIRGLHLYGIDRAVGISSATGDREERERLLKAAERGEFIFVLVAPERMQSPVFRDTLRVMSSISRVNLAVIDEAHCVSEWGHDFRPAYLNLARNLRRLGATNGHPPTILALTGTASRAVLRDMVADLELDARTKNAIVRPASFDRQELSFRIVETDSRNVRVDFRSVLMELPPAFSCSGADFYTPAGKNTFSGVVFTSFAKGQNGVIKLRDEIMAVARTSATIYSGGPPLQTMNRILWNTERRENARRFMANEAPVLVATKAFGMGIDKPNIRYTIHFGMPGSLEAFYQEAGRAGRDRRPAKCIVLFSKPAPHIESELDLIRRQLPELRSAFQATAWNARGDLGSALFFHLNSFKGPEEELNDVRNLATRLQNLRIGESVEFDLPRAEEEKKRLEKALFRLVQVGVLADYELDYGRYIIRAIGGSREHSTIQDRILDYVRRSDSGRVADVQKQLEPIVSRGSSINTVVDLIGVLIGFCYDTIERARRRSIFEAMEAAKQGRDPANFRRRLLDYLQEGMDPESLQRLVETEEINFSVCEEMLRKTNNVIEAGELRGITIRFLESYPDHPVLLVLRALSESLSEDCDDTVVLDSLRQLLGPAVDKYSVTQSTLDEAVGLIARVAENRSPRLFPALLLAIEEGEYTTIDRSVTYDELCRRGLKAGSEEVYDLVILARLRENVDRLKTVMGILSLENS